MNIIEYIGYWYQEILVNEFEEDIVNEALEKIIKEAKKTDNEAFKRGQVINKKEIEVLK